VEAFKAFVMSGHVKFAMTEDEVIKEVIRRTKNGTLQWSHRGDQKGEEWYEAKGKDGLLFKFRPLLTWRLFWWLDCTYLYLNNQCVSSSPQKLEPLHDAIKKSFALANAKELAQAIELLDRTKEVS